MDKRKKSFVKPANTLKSNTLYKPLKNNGKNNGIQCRECERYGHIQGKCTNTLKKKTKTMNRMWSNVESEESQQNDEDRVSNYVAFIIISKSQNFDVQVSKTDVATSFDRCYNITTTENDSELGDGDEDEVLKKK